MQNKKLNLTLSLISGIAVLLIAIFCIFYFFFPLDAIKDFAAAKLSGQLKREVRIKSVSLDIFSGIKLKGVTISNAKGFSPEPMVSADSLELKYAFLPLFQGKVVIPEIKFVKPRILIEKDKTGDMNYSDIFAEEKPKKNTAKKALEEKKPQGGPNIDLLVNNFSLVNGEIIYYDHLVGRSALGGVNLKISNITLLALKPIDVKFSAAGSYLGKAVPVSISGKVAFDVKTQDELKLQDFVISIAGETLMAAVDVKGLKKGPQISAALKSDKLMIDPFLAIFAAGGGGESKKEAAPYGALTRSLKNTFSSIPSNVGANIQVDLKNASLKTLKLDALSFNASLASRRLSAGIKDLSAYKGSLYAKAVRVDLAKLSYSIGNLELHGFNAAPFLNDMIDSFAPAFIDMKNNVEGTLDISMQVKGSGVEMPDMLDNVKGSGIIILSKGRIKKIKSLSAVGEQYNINLLKQEMIIAGLRVQAAISDKVLNVTRLSLQDTDLQAEFAGALNFNKMEYKPGNRLTLKLSENATKSLPQQLAMLRDEKGFVGLDFELQGSLYKPFPSPLFQKPIEAVVGKLKIKIEAKKVEIETKAQQQLVSAEAEAKQKLEQEAKKKIKEIIKF